MSIKTKLHFKKAEFILSAASQKQFPRLLNPGGEEMSEIAFVGRSNVGKSSLINHLMGCKNLAKVSSTPGKTQLINFFIIDQMLGLVDLPGYGFAKVSKKMREAWGNLTEDYLQNRKNLALILLLIDARHPPTKEDLAFAKWAVHFQKPLFIVFTKTDKLKQSEQIGSCQKHLNLFLQEINVKSLLHIHYSIKDARARSTLIKKIQSRFHGIDN